MTKKITIQGIIIVDDFDSNGNPLHYALLTDDENKFLIEPCLEKSDLVFADFNRKKVLVTGISDLSERGNVIAVKEIKSLENASSSSFLDAL